MSNFTNHNITFLVGKCTQCGLCQADCPQLAIHPSQEQIDKTCIKCDHCVAICPVGALAVNGNVPPDLPAFSISSSHFLHLIKSKRSVRRFLDKPVDQDAIQQLVEAFQWIPTAKNARESYMQIITGDKLSQLDSGTSLTLVKTFNRLFNSLTRPLWFLLVGKKAKLYFKTKQRFIERRANQPFMITHKAPLVLLFHAPKSIMSNGAMDNNIAAAYIALYANTLGLATCYNGYIVKALSQNSKLSKDMGIPQNNQVFSALLVGYPKYRYLREVVR